MSRPYVSRLRAEQAEATRAKVVEAVATVLGRGLTDLTYPAVATEAGVSLATVQRLFPNKRDLVSALADHYNETVRNLFATTQPLRDIEDFLAQLPEVLARTSQVAPALRAAVQSEPFQEHRRETRRTRLKMIDDVLKQFRGNLPAVELRYIRNLMTVLSSSAGVQAFSDLTGAGHEEASDAIVWMARRLLSLSEQPPGPPHNQPTRGGQARRPRKP